MTRQTQTDRTSRPFRRSSRWTYNRCSDLISGECCCSSATGYRTAGFDTFSDPAAELNGNEMFLKVEKGALKIRPNFLLLWFLNKFSTWDGERDAAVGPKILLFIQGCFSNFPRRAHNWVLFSSGYLPRRSFPKLRRCFPLHFESSPVDASAFSRAGGKKIKTEAGTASEVRAPRAACSRDLPGNPIRIEISLAIF